MAVSLPLIPDSSTQRRCWFGFQTPTFVVQALPSAASQATVTRPPSPGCVTLATGANQLARPAPSLIAFHTSSIVASISISSSRTRFGFLSLMRTSTGLALTGAAGGGRGGAAGGGARAASGGPRGRGGGG